MRPTLGLALAALCTLAAPVASAVDAPGPAIRVSGPGEPCQDPRLTGLGCVVCGDVLYYDPPRIGPYDPPPFGKYLVVCRTAGPPGDAVP